MARQARGRKETPHNIFISTHSTSAVWTQQAHGRNLDEKSYDRSIPMHNWPANGTDVSTQNLNDLGLENRQIARDFLTHDWSHDSVFILANGDRIQKQDGKVFYTVNPGGTNEQVYTILYLENRIAL